MVNNACFPVSYQETYYKDVVASAKRYGDGLCKLAYYNGFVVGATCARIEPINNSNQPPSAAAGGQREKQKDSSSTTKQTQQPKRPKKRIYIMTLGVLAAYRGRSIGTQLIQSILDYWESNSANKTNRKTDQDDDNDNTENENDNLMKDVVEISLHVQISNVDALNFYETKFGFQRGELVQNYYRRIDPPHCYRLYKQLV